jgi:hypothetical protein
MNPMAVPDEGTNMLAPVEGLPARVLCWVGAAALVVSGLVHLHLWDIAYRHVDTLGPLFVVQGIAALVLAVALVVWPRPLVALAGAGLALGTILGFVKALNGGIFGFTLPVVTGWANLALVAEIVAVIVLAAAVSVTLVRRPTADAMATPSPSGV